MSDLCQINCFLLLLLPYQIPFIHLFPQIVLRYKCSAVVHSEKKSEMNPNKKWPWSWKQREIHKKQTLQTKNPTSESSLLDPARRLKWQFKPSRSTTFNQNQLTQKNTHRLWPPVTCAKWYCNASDCLMQCSRPACHAVTTWPSWGYILKMKWLKGFQRNPCGTELKLQILQTDGPCS